MIRPAIAPTRVFNPISRGLFTAARNSVSQVQQSTQKISRGLNKDQKFAMNYVEFFGSKKTTKVLRKNLKALRESLTATFAMAKTLKKKVSSLSKTGGLLSSVLGGVGGLLGGGLFGKLALGLIAGLAIGGIGFLLYKNAGTFFKFLSDKIDLLTPIVERIFKNFIKRTALGGELSEEIGELSSVEEKNIRNEAEKLMENDNNLTLIDALDEATSERIEQINLRLDELGTERNALSSDFVRSNLNAIISEIAGVPIQAFASDQKRKRELDLEIKKLQTLRSSLESGRLFGGGESGVNPFSFFLDGPPVPANYGKLSENSRLSRVKSFVNQSGKDLDTLKFELLRASSLGGPDRVRFFEDVLNFIDAKKKGDTSSFNVLPDNLINSDFNAIRKENMKEFENLFPNVFKTRFQRSNPNIFFPSRPENKIPNTNNGGEVSSTKADGGRSEIAFFSPQNSDSSMEKLSSCVMYGCYMDA